MHVLTEFTVVSRDTTYVDVDRIGFGAYLPDRRTDGQEDRQIDRRTDK